MKFDMKAPAAPEAKAPPPAASDMEDAAADLIAAVKAGDAKAAHLALMRHTELSKGEPDEDDYEEA